MVELSYEGERSTNDWAGLDSQVVEALAESSDTGTSRIDTSRTRCCNDGANGTHKKINATRWPIPRGLETHHVCVYRKQAECGVRRFGVLRSDDSYNARVRQTPRKTCMPTVGEVSVVT